MTFSGEWRTQGAADATHFNFISNSLVAIQKQSTGPEPVPYQWAVEDATDSKKVITLTHATSAPILFHVESMENDRIQLKSVAGGGGEEDVEVLVLIPAGMGSVNDSLVEEDSGVDMGMDLCLTGTSAKIHKGDA